MQHELALILACKFVCRQTHRMMLECNCAVQYQCIAWQSALDPGPSTKLIQFRLQVATLPHVVCSNSVLAKTSFGINNAANLSASQLIAIYTGCWLSMMQMYHESAQFSLSLEWKSALPRTLLLRLKFASILKIRGWGSQKIFFSLDRPLFHISYA